MDWCERTAAGEYAEPAAQARLRKLRPRARSAYLVLQCTSETEDEYAKADFEKNRDRCARFSVIQGTLVMGNLALNTM